MGAPGATSPFERVTVEGGQVRATVAPAHAFDLCVGHFPGDPLLPGAYLAELMAEVAARLLAAEGELPVVPPEIRRCVFLARVRPTQRIVVSARRSDAAIVEVAVTADGERAAQATIRFGAPA